MPVSKIRKNSKSIRRKKKRKNKKTVNNNKLFKKKNSKKFNNKYKTMKKNGGAGGEGEEKSTILEEGSKTISETRSKASLRSGKKRQNLNIIDTLNEALFIMFQTEQSDPTTKIIKKIDPATPDKINLFEEIFDESDRELLTEDLINREIRSSFDLIKSEKTYPIDLYCNRICLHISIINYTISKKTNINELNKYEKTYLFLSSLLLKYFREEGLENVSEELHNSLTQEEEKYWKKYYASDNYKPALSTSKINGKAKNRIKHHIRHKRRMRRKLDICNQFECPLLLNIVVNSEKLLEGKISKFCRNLLISFKGICWKILLSYGKFTTDLNDIDDIDKERKKLIETDDEYTGINKIIQIDLLNFVLLEDIRFFYYDIDGTKEKRFYQLIINENSEYKMKEINDVKGDPKKYIVAQLATDEKKIESTIESYGEEYREEVKKLYKSFPRNFCGTKNSEIIDHFNKNLVYLKKTASDIDIGEFISIGGQSITFHWLFSTLGAISNKYF